VEIVWDERKRMRNIEVHGLDFRALHLDFFDGAVVVPAKQGTTDGRRRVRGHRSS
jgi:uncharacterized DUF497 family protein